MKTKIIFVIVLVAMLMTTTLKAQLINESFDYPSGDSIGAHGWVHFSPTGAGTLNRIIVTAPGLEYAGFQNQGLGNAASLLNSGQDSYKPLSANQNSGSVYTFFLVKVDTVRTTGDYFCAYLPSTSATSFLCRVYARKMTSSGNKFSFGLSKTTTTGGIQWSDTVYSKGTTYLIAMKYKFNSASNTDDEVSLFVFTTGVPSAEPAPTIGPLTGTGTDGADIGRFALRQGTESSASNLTIDEIFTASSWNGALPVESEGTTGIPEKYYLYQNYPNPFNPNTNLEFGISELGFVSLKVYNASGKEVATLVNEIKPAGYYSVNFNASNLSSGVYFYRINAERRGSNFVSVKKMTLVK